MKVKISEIVEIAKRRKEINNIPLERIEFIDDDGNQVQIEQDRIDEFQFTGLSNCDFITSDFYKNGYSI